MHHTVTYFETHTGHQLDELSWCHAKIPDSVRFFLADKLSQKVPKEELLKMRKLWSGRPFMVKRKDLMNIQNQFGMQNDVLHADEAISVFMLINQLGDEVLYVKEQGKTDKENPNIGEDEFVLIIMKTGQESVLKHHQNNNNLELCMDSTHGISGHGFEATTLMCITDLNDGFPLSVCISSNVNTGIITLFLNKIKEKVGLMKAHVFMSDDTDIFRNSFINSFGQSSISNILTCSWHVDSAWQKFIHTMKNVDFKTRLEIYRICRILMETADEIEFWDLATSFLSWLNEKDCQDFYKYFEGYYLKEEKVKLWAWCYRSGINLHTNNYLEAMHKSLKHIYMKGKKITRLDKSIQAYLDLVDDKVHNRLVNLLFGKVGEKHFAKKHSEGIKLKVVAVSDIEFNVESQSRENEFYLVKQRLPECNDCIHRCSACKVCKHMFICECIDFRKYVCKHVHAVMYYLIQNRGIKLPETRPAIEEIHILFKEFPPEEFEEFSPEECSIDGLAFSGRKPIKAYHDQYDIGKNVSSKINVCMTKFRTGEYETNSYEMVVSFTKQLNQVLSGLESLARNELQCFAKKTNNIEPSNKNIEQQKRYSGFFSTKAKRKSKASALKAPTSEEKEILTSILEQQKY